jgi:cell wall-associated NlpC family hydrolase
MPSGTRALRAVVRALRLMAELREVVDPQAPLRRAPSPEAPLDTEALKGERIVVDEMNDEGWVHGRLESDGYSGWLPARALALPGPTPTHKVSVLRTLAFPGPSIKLPPAEGLSLGSRVAIARSDATFAVTAAGLHIPARHLTPVDGTEADPVAVAERFLGVPYLWGGKTSLGLDCSGLVQIALTACGVLCPRDSHQQEEALGARVAGVTELRRGDLIFWKGHVALARDGISIVHANAYHMAVAIEPLANAAARSRAAGGEITSVRRLR